MQGPNFQISLFLGRAGQVQQIGQRKVAHLAKAQDVAPHGVEPAQTVQAAGFVAGHPQPIAGEGRGRQQRSLRPKPRVVFRFVRCWRS
jgi:hypothetical protein